MLLKELKNTRQRAIVSAGVGAARYLDVLRLHAAGANRYLELLVTPVLEGGKVGHMICLVRDVTALVQQQQKLDAPVAGALRQTSLQS